MNHVFKLIASNVIPSPRMLHGVVPQYFQAVREHQKCHPRMLTRKKRTSTSLSGVYGPV
ncbi:hypothetical protein IIC38_06485 [candidate division KSB1 bacterium]|nr:hypothetical protein [candidate division KSB1 bacterium]